MIEVLRNGSSVMAFFESNDFVSLEQKLNIDSKVLVKDLQHLHLLRQCGRCSRCRRERTLIIHKGRYVGRCKSCRNKIVSIREGTFFGGVRLAFRSVLRLAFLWSAKVPVQIVHNLIRYRKDVIAQYYRYFRDICSWKLLANPQDIQVGGPGHVVQIDESVITKRKHNKGRVVPEQWILGILDTTTNIGIVRYVQRRDANTLLPIIRDVVKQGSEIWTDEWRAYNRLSNLGFVHHTVCHKREFKAADGTCTNAVEGLWSVLKKHLRLLHVLQSPLLPEHIDEFMWRRVYCRGATTGSTFRTLLTHITERYPC